MAQSLLLRNAYIRAAFKQAAKCNVTPVALLEDILLGRFKIEGQTGQMVISTSENGGSVSMSVPDGFGPTQVMELAEECIEWLNEQTDPAAPDLTLLQRPVRRLRAGFDMGVIS